jgi:hypothetical protein
MESRDFQGTQVRQRAKLHDSARGDHEYGAFGRRYVVDEDLLALEGQDARAIDLDWQVTRSSSR